MATLQAEGGANAEIVELIDLIGGIPALDHPVKARGRCQVEAGEPSLFDQAMLGRRGRPFGLPERPGWNRPRVDLASFDCAIRRWGALDRQEGPARRLRRRPLMKLPTSV